MTKPRIPGEASEQLELPCGETVAISEIDLGMREVVCDSGETHAVVMDVHPPDRFLPETLVSVLQEVVETTSEEMPEFGTPHLLGMVMEEYPEKVVSHDASENQDVGFALLWITEFDSWRLHEIIVELVIELMEHAISHADDTSALTEFESKMHEFDVETFVEEYRAERNLSEDDLY